MDGKKMNEHLTLTEAFRPKRMEEMLGNSQAIREVEESVISSKPFIAFGPQGTGKTTVVYCIANNLNFKVIEWNASDARRKADLQVILRQIQSRGFGTRGQIFFLDEMDNCDDWTTIADIIKKAKFPLALACNDLYKIPPKIQQLCSKIRFWPPHKDEVCKLIARIEKATGRKANYNAITQDFRSSINNCFNGGSSYDSTNIFDETLLFFKKRETKHLNVKEHSKYLIDNAENFYSGKTLYEMSQLLVVCDQLQDFSILKVLPKGKMGGKVEYPRFIKRASDLKRGKKE
jgi:DNA polymerase III delta prime subunit